METNLAVLIDFENIAAGTEKDGLGRFDVELVLARLSDKGRVLIARSYADWGRFARFKQGLLTNNVSMMELTSHGMQDKNRADIALVVDGMELAFTKPYIDTFVVVSGDSDFTPMVLKMRELDKRVIGCGCRSSTSRLLIQACDEFIFYDNLAKRQTRRKTERTKATGAPANLQAAFDLLADALEGLQRENPDPPLAGIVKSAILRKSPDFSENDLGFSSFARFLDRARKAGIVALSRDEKSGGYRVDAPQGNGDERAPTETRSESRPSRSDDGDSDNDNDDSLWLDAYLPEGTQGWVETLAAEGMNPLAAPTRKAILQALEEVVVERNKKRRRVTVQFVQEDVRRRLRKTHPDLPARGVRHVFNALMRAGAFIHRDGTSVRTGSAPFTLQKSAEQLNETLSDIYVDELHRSGANLDIPLLADLFFGDRSHTRPVEMSVAYLQANSDEDPLDEPSVLDLDDALLLDDDDDMLLSADDDSDEAPKAKAPKAETKAPKAEAKGKSEAVDETATAKKADADEKKPARKKASRKRTSKKAAAKTDDGKADASAEKKATAKVETAAKDDDASDDAPKRKRTRTRKKADAKPASTGSDDLDSMLSED